MTSPSAPYARTGRIVVGVDGSPASTLALEWACHQAGLLNRSLHLVHTYVVSVAYAGVGSFSTALESDLTLMAAAAEETLADALSAARALAPDTDITSATVEGSAAAALVDASSGAYAVVTGARGRGPLTSTLLGSVSTQVAMHAHSPVVVVKAFSDSADRGHGVVVGFDGSEHAQACLAFAFEQAAARGTSLDVVNVWPLEPGHGTASAADAVSTLREIGPSHQLFVDEVLAEWTEKYPDVEVHASVVHGHAVPVLLEHSATAELLVVGSRGRGGFTGLVLGSVSHTVLQRAECPVAVVRGLT